MADLTTEEIAELRRLLNERRKVGPWYGNLRPFDFGEWGPSTATLLAAAGNALPALLDMAERCAKAEAELAKLTCKCSLRTKLVGDGCDICNPEENA